MIDPIFIPFSEGSSSRQDPWLPFSPTPSRDYFAFRSRISKRLDNVTGSLGVENFACSSFKSLALEFGRTGDWKPSGYWNQFITSTAFPSNLYHFICLLFDFLFIQLSLPQPSEDQYTKTLALRDVLTEAWLTQGQKRSQATLLIHSCLSCFLGALDIRFLALGNGKRQKLARIFASPLPPCLFLLLLRPLSMLHADRTLDLAIFILHQFRACAGEVDNGENVIYHLFSGGAHYIGRTSAVRNRAGRIYKGIGSRWSEHVRELALEKSGKSGQRRRRRYRVLVNRHCCVGVNIVAVDIVPLSSATKAEAVAIPSANPEANGCQYKHLSQHFQYQKRINNTILCQNLSHIEPAQPQNPRRSRTRQNFSERRRNKRVQAAGLRQRDAMWGASELAHQRGVTLAEKRLDRIGENFDRHETRNGRGQATKRLLVGSYTDVYRSFQCNIVGPINLYCKSSILLMLHVMSCGRLGARHEWKTFITRCGCTIDYMYHAIQLCAFIPYYRSRERAITSIRAFLNSIGMISQSTFIARISCQHSRVNFIRWLRQCIGVSYGGCHHLQRFISSRLRIVEIPEESWNRRLVNIQKAIRRYT